MATLLLLLISSCLATITSLRLSMQAQLSGHALIVQNKGGGHGTIGYSVCKQLRKLHPNLKVTLLQEKCNRNKEPFSSYNELESLGVTIIDDEISSGSTQLKNEQFNFVIDNWSKSEANATFISEIAKNSNCEQLVFISSGGMYKDSNVLPCVETSPVKTNAARKCEAIYQSSTIPYTFVRPQYLYGAHSNKHYLDYFIGRAIRCLPIPLPLHGDQLLSLTHHDDAASMVIHTLSNHAINDVFNCVGSRYITYRGLCELIHDALGTQEDDRKYLFYEPQDFDQWEGEGVQVGTIPYLYPIP